MSNYSSLSRVLSPFRVQTKFEENTLPARSTDIMLGCIVLGEENAFPVDFVKEKTIGHLKGAIKEQAGLAEPAHKLILWRVNIPENEKHEIYEGIDIKEKFGGEKLDSDLKTIRQVFKEQPLSEHIHIIVELPATTGKRRRIDSDSNEESGTRKKEKQTYPSESEEGCDSLIAISPERFKRIADFVENNKITLLRSPPSSGKSTLGQVLRDHFDNSSHDSIYISLAGIHGKKAINDEELFNDFWHEQVGRTWTEISKSKKTTYVIVDEVQIIYGDGAPFFWGVLKGLLSSEGYHLGQNLRFLFLGTYHPTLDPKLTPIEFRHTLGLNDLLLGWEEINQLTKNFVQLHMIQGSHLFRVPDSIQKAMLKLTGGHPGLCRLILSSLRSHFRDYNDVTEVNMMRYLASSELRNSITDYSRAFYWIRDWKPNDDEEEFIRNILLCVQAKASFNIDYDSNLICKSFIKSGVLAIVGEKIQFTAPIMRIILCHRLFTCPASLRTPTSPASFENFLYQTIERMSPSKLSKSLGRSPEPSNSRLYERGWQMEWYRSATTIVPIDASISADVGPVFEESAGFLDFYINSELCWGVELIREGDRLSEHAQRFEEGGDYENIPLKDWVIMDFRHHTKQVRGLKQKFWYVLYEDDYRRVTIRRSGQKDKVLALHGDEASYCKNVF